MSVLHGSNALSAPILLLVPIFVTAAENTEADVVFTVLPCLVDPVRVSVRNSSIYWLVKLEETMSVNHLKLQAIHVPSTEISAFLGTFIVDMINIPSDWLKFGE